MNKMDKNERLDKNKENTHGKMDKIEIGQIKSFYKTDKSPMTNTN